MQSIFISYSHDDRAFTNRLARDLTVLGFKVWYDRWELAVGDSLIERIQKGLKDASWMIAVLSPASINSKWVQQELNASLSRQLTSGRAFILPILYRDCDPPEFLVDRIYADFRQDYNFGLQELTTSLRKHGRATRDLYASNYDTWRESVSVWYRRAPDIGALAGLWRGSTGRLVLRAREGDYEGEYDWQGYEYSGKIWGKFISGVLFFNWTWQISAEYGKGIFYFPFPGILFGGWWLEGDKIDAKTLVEQNELPPNHWGFRKEREDVEQGPSTADGTDGNRKRRGSRRSSA